MDFNLNTVSNSGIPFVSLYSNLDNFQKISAFRLSALNSYIKNFDLIKKNVNLYNFIKNNDFYIPENDILPSLPTMMKYPTFDIDAYTVVIVNGYYVEELSYCEDIPFNVFSTLKSFDCDNLELVKKTLEKNINDDVFISLNNAFLSNLVLIDIPENVILDKPINIISIAISDKNKKGKIFIPSNIIMNIRDGVKVDIIETNLSLNRESYFENKILNIISNKNSMVNYYIASSVSSSSCIISNTFVDAYDFSSVNFVNYIGNSGILKQKYNFNLQSNIDASFVSSVSANDLSSINVDVLLSHLGNDSNSSAELYGVADGSSSIYFKTNVKCATFTSNIGTSQTSKIILKSDTANARIEPYQMISTENAKAFHGAVISGISEEDLFFLESRGINKSVAKELICNSCISNILNNINNDKIYDGYLNFMKI